MRERFQNSETRSGMIRVFVCLVLMVISITVIAPKASKPEAYKGTIEKLNAKEQMVLDVTGFATVSSIGLAAFPDDATTPVANKIMDLAGYLVIVLCAIVLEKYLLSIAGYLSFHWLIPIALAMFGLNTFIKNRSVSKLAAKIIILCIALMAVVPLSVSLSDMIEATYQITIEAEKSDSAASEISENVSEAIEAEAESESQETAEKSSNPFVNMYQAAASALSDAYDAAADVAEKASSYVSDLTEEAIASAQGMIQDLFEKVVVLIVTNCLIPVFVLMVLFWSLNLILGLQIDIPDPRRFSGQMHFRKEDESERG